MELYQTFFIRIYLQLISMRMRLKLGCCITLNGGDTIKIGFIGPGKVGVNLGRYFTHKGIKISGFYGNNSKEASEITNSKSYDNYEEIIKDSNILFITTPDDIISIIDREISKFDLKNKSICHASGSLKSTILSNAKLSGALIYSIHPMFAFSNKNMSIKKLEQIYFSIEGDLKNQNINDFPVIGLMNHICNKYFIRNIEDSAKYHLANVFVSNLVLSLIDIGTGYLKELGLSEEHALNALFPLIEGNLESIHKNGFVKSLTGPVVRRDIKTINKHLESLNDEDIELYKSLSLNLLRLAEKQNSNIEENHCLNLTNGNEENALNISKKNMELFRLLGGIE